MGSGVDRLRQAVVHAVNVHPRGRALQYLNEVLRLCHASAVPRAAPVRRRHLLVRDGAEARAVRGAPVYDHGHVIPFARGAAREAGGAAGALEEQQVAGI